MRTTLAIAFATALAACGPTKEAPQDAAAPDAAPGRAPAPDASVAADAAAPDAAAADAAAPDAAATGALPGVTEGCPDGMVLVAGNYCPLVNQRCVEHHEEYAKDEKRKKKAKEGGEDAAASTVSERCLRYAEPTECLSKAKKPMRFCVDRYEYPNQKGEKPALLISWVEAKKTCEKLGKRLCTEEEFNFACEGEAMLPYTYGFARDATKCSIDKPYIKRQKKLYTYDRCMQKPECKKELERLDQRLPSGSLDTCVSPFGVYDMNGNINEWVELPGKKYPDRSGLKGGWWGPVRGRCRPTVGFHKEEDYGYEEGFRCCKDG